MNLKVFSDIDNSPVWSGLCAVYFADPFLCSKSNITVKEDESVYKKITRPLLQFANCLVYLFI